MRKDDKLKELAVKITRDYRDELRWRDNDDLDSVHHNYILTTKIQFWAEVAGKDFDICIMTRDSKKIVKLVRQFSGGRHAPLKSPHGLAGPIYAVIVNNSTYNRSPVCGASSVVQVSLYRNRCTITWGSGEKKTFQVIGIKNK